jgi:hypothetical protein
MTGRSGFREPPSPSSHAFEMDLYAHVFGAGNGVRIEVAGAEVRARSCPKPQAQERDCGALLFLVAAIEL